MVDGVWPFLSPSRDLAPGAKRSEALAAGTHQHIAKTEGSSFSYAPRDKGSTCAPDKERQCYGVCQAALSAAQQHGRSAVAEAARTHTHDATAGRDQR